MVWFISTWYTVIWHDMIWQNMIQYDIYNFCCKLQQCVGKILQPMFDMYHTRWHRTVCILWNCPVPMQYSWRLWINIPGESTRTGCVTIKQQQQQQQQQQQKLISKPCPYCMGYSVAFLLSIFRIAGTRRLNKPKRRQRGSVIDFVTFFLVYPGYQSSLVALIGSKTISSPFTF